VRAVWPEFLAKVKKLGRAGVMAKMPYHRFAGSVNIPVEYIEAFFEAALASGAVQVLDEDWVVTNWSAYQVDDRTGAERQKNLRERRKAEREAKLAAIRASSPESVTDVTPPSQEHNDVMPSGITGDVGDNAVTTVTGDESKISNGVTPSCATTRPPDHQEKEPSEEGSKKPLPPDLDLISDQSKWWSDPVSGKVDELASVLGRWAESVKWKTGTRPFPDAVIDRQAMQSVATWLLDFLPDQDTLIVQLSSLAEWALRAPKSRQSWTHPHLVLRKCLGEKEESWRKVRRQRQWDAERSSKGHSAPPPTTTHPPKKIEILDPKEEWARPPASTTPLDRLVESAACKLKSPETEGFISRRRAQIQEVLGPNQTATG
jgi:hypothetical protein